MDSHHLPEECITKTEYETILAWSFQEALESQLTWLKNHSCTDKRRLQDILSKNEKEKYLAVLEWTFIEADTMEILEQLNEVEDNLPMHKSPLCKWEAIKNIQECFKKYLQGDKNSIFKALHLSLRFNLPPPKWLSTELKAAYYKYELASLKNWNEIFGETVPKGAQFEAERRNRERSLPVYVKILLTKAADPKTPIDAALFGSIGDEFGIKKTTVEKLYKRQREKESSLLFQEYEKLLESTTER